jgi:aminopeptidase YwaD
MSRLLLIALLFWGAGLKAQNRDYVKYLVNNLAGDDFAGRGYVDSRLHKAAVFIAYQFDSLKLETLDDGRFQSFNHPVNVFNGACEVYLGRPLTPGVDFLVQPESPSFSGTLQIQRIDSVLISNPQEIKILPGYAALVQQVSANNFDLNAQRNSLIRELSVMMPVINPVKKLTWSVGNEQTKFPIIEVIDTLPELLNENTLTLNIETELVEFTSKNVIAEVKAKKKSKRYIVFTAHYDHLGKMGPAIFPGANDNASGTAVMLDFARYFAQNPLKKYNVLFIAFAGEEAGLVGSKHFSEMPLLPLSDIRFLLNLDLLGNGDDGITVVNGKLFEKDFAKLTAINKKFDYVEKLRARGEAANSDHYWFTKRGVPSFFIYTQGARSAYHDVRDVPETLHFYGYENIHRLILQFIESL